ncbi:MAG: hypothetical protein WC389_08960 [Lutibacter sp.]|jgi:hypothetical protein
MNDKQFTRLMEFAFVGGGFIPANQNAQELMDGLRRGEVVAFNEVTTRDVKFHRCYFSLISQIWGYMPKQFKQSVPREQFYHWLKHLKGEYQVRFKFKDGTTLVEYESIAFGNMSERRFHDYIKEQLPWIYENVLGVYFGGEMLAGIIETIEDDYQRFMSKI